MRTIDGTNNNCANPAWGSAGSRLLRLAPVAYSDGESEPRVGPNARDISNRINWQAGAARVANDRRLSAWIWQWGQFLDHDIDLTPAGGKALPIPTSVDDPHFEGEPIPFVRSAWDAATGSGPGNPRQQVNVITAYIDGSAVYGSDAVRAAFLRSFEGGRLKTSDGDLLPFNDPSDPIPNDRGPGGLIPVGQDFAAGDFRANEQIGLTAVHTLFVREHNRIAARIQGADPGLDDEEIYQRARKIVGAEIQVITYEEWLPALLGRKLDPYAGYDPNVNAGIANEFSTAAFRFGHSMLAAELLRLDRDGSIFEHGNIALRDAFFSPREIIDRGGIEPLLAGFARQLESEIDVLVIDEVRNFLFGPPGAGGFDLASLNIQRGRDHGLPDYNTMRIAYGLPPVATFGGITSDDALAQALEDAYVNVNAVDPWVGGLAEDHLPGSSLGPLLEAVITEQFERLRSGDRFFYLNDPFFTDDARLLAEIRSTRLADVLRRNTAWGSYPGNAFFATGSDVSPKGWRRRGTAGDAGSAPGEG